VVVVVVVAVVVVAVVVVVVAVVEQNVSGCLHISQFAIRFETSVCDALEFRR
jgi:hypothetical protein